MLGTASTEIHSNSQTIVFGVNILTFALASTATATTATSDLTGSVVAVVVVVRRAHAARGRGGAAPGGRSVGGSDCQLEAACADGAGAACGGGSDDGLGSTAAVVTATITAAGAAVGVCSEQAVTRGGAPEHFILRIGALTGAGAGTAHERPLDVFWQVERLL